jgi:hypothetical protein
MATTVNVTGKVLLPDGTGAPGGTIQLRLSQPGTTDDAGSEQVVATLQEFTIASDGSVNFNAVPNDAINPAGTFYHVTYTLSTGEVATESWQLASSPATIDIGLVPRLAVSSGYNIPTRASSGDLTGTFVASDEGAILLDPGAAGVGSEIGGIVKHDDDSYGPVILGAGARKAFPERIIWQGRDVNHFSVGMGKLYKYNHLQDAIDRIATLGDNAHTNPYLISLDVGDWIYNSTDPEPPVRLSLSHVSIVGVDRERCIVRRAYDGSTGSGGTLVVAYDDTVLTEDVLLSNFRLITDLKGVHGAGEGQPPEGSLYIGKEEIYPDSRHWNRIRVLGMQIEGSHDGIQFFGVNSLAGAGIDNLGSAEFGWNVVRCCHDAVTYKGNSRLRSHHNFIECNSLELLPFIPSTRVAAWKTTGFHISGASFMDELAVTDDALVDAVFESSHDTIEVRAPLGGQVENTGGDQSACAGFLMYETTGSRAHALPLVRITEPTIRLSYDQDGGAGGNVLVGGIVATDSLAGGARDDDTVLIKGGSIDVDIPTDRTNSPDEIAGILDDRTGGGGTLRPLKAAGTIIAARNNKTGGNAYSLLAQSSGLIEAEIFSDQARAEQGSGLVNPLAKITT